MNEVISETDIKVEDKLIYTGSDPAEGLTFGRMYRVREAGEYKVFLDDEEHKHGVNGKYLTTNFKVYRSGSVYELV